MKLVDRSMNNQNRFYFSISVGAKIWKDEFLVWNVTEYGGISELTLPVEDIWIPDVNIANRYISNHKLDFCTFYSTFVKLRAKYFICNLSGIYLSP